MASISTNKKDGTRRIFFIGANGRKIIHLGKMPLRDVREIKTKVEALNTARLANVSVANETAQWVGALDARLYGKLVAVGLVTAREAKPEAVEAVKLGPFLDAYIESRTDVKQPTRENLERVRGKLVGYFGADKPLADVTQEDAAEFRRYLGRPKAKKGDGQAENTVRRICGRSKQFFRAAVRGRLITESPFADMKDTNVRANASRDFYVTLEMADRVLDACPDAQWRLLFALARFGGLRCPSEHLGLRWGDIDWAGGRMTIHSPKTEHHAGRASRVIPIFPELLAHLEQVWEEAAPGTEYVITRYRQSNCNLRTQFNRIVRKASLKPWQKPFQNLRSTRETELADVHPIHVVVAWLGNTEAVAKEHYLKVTDAHFERAQIPTHNPTHKGAKLGKTGTNGAEADSKNPRENRDFPEFEGAGSYPARTRT